MGGVCLQCLLLSPLLSVRWFLLWSPESSGSETFLSSAHFSWTPSLPRKQEKKLKSETHPPPPPHTLFSLLQTGGRRDASFQINILWGWGFSLVVEKRQGEREGEREGNLGRVTSENTQNPDLMKLPTLRHSWLSPPQDLLPLYCFLHSHSGCLEWFC